MDDLIQWFRGNHIGVGKSPKDGENKRYRRPNRTEEEKAAAHRLSARMRYADPTIRPKIKAAACAQYQKTEYRDRAKKYQAGYYLKTKYNMTREDYEAMVVVQGGKCLVCSTNSEKLVIDHDHITGSVRGLLCNACNTLEGHIKKTGLSPSEFAEKFQIYLDRFLAA